MQKYDLNWYNRNIDLEQLILRMGWEIDKKGSTKNSPKYSNGADKIIVNRRKNTFFSVVDDKSGSSANFVAFFVLGISDPRRASKEDYKRWFKELSSIAGTTNALEDLQRNSSISSSKENRARQNSAIFKARTYLEKYCRPAKDHHYLVKERKIDAQYLKLDKFKHCLKTPSQTGRFNNLLAVHRNIEGVCSYESHNITKSGTLKLYKKDAPKCIWHTDDIYSPNIDGIFIGEALIDTLSAGSITNQNLALLTTGGAFDKSENSPTVLMLKKILSEAKTNKIILGNDNDKKGLEYDSFFSEFIESNFPGKFIVQTVKPQMFLNDWNEYLKVLDFSKRSQLKNFASNTDQLIIAEGGLGKFRMIRSQNNKKSTTLTYPPKGWDKNCRSIAQAFIATMANSNPKSSILFTPSTEGDFKYAENLKKWTEHFIPSLSIRTIREGKPFVDYLLGKGKIGDISLSPSWKGFSEIRRQPHRMAQTCNKIVLTTSPDKKVRYYHSSYPPTTVIVATPISSSTENISEINLFLKEVSKFNENNTKIILSPATQEGKKTLKHCSFLKTESHKPENTFYTKFYPEKGRNHDGFNNVLELLSAKNLIVGEHYNPHPSAQPQEPIRVSLAHGSVR